MKKIKYAVLGFGNRGKVYTGYCFNHKNEYDVVAIIEPDKSKTEDARKEGYRVFESLDDFLKEKIEADIVCVATQDNQHFEHAIRLMESGYNLLLEKPISTDIDKCLKIEEVANKYSRKVFVCHVLRYTAFYNKIKELLLNDEVGNIINIQTEENIGYWHMAHSYVRGPWRNRNNSNPIILAKCCHDLDLICWFMDKKCVSVNSLGELSYFKHENKPVGAGEYCSSCPKQKECVYDAWKIYPIYDWPNIHYMSDEPTLENIKKKLPGTRFEKCVFDQDNNVCDHQTVIMKFENGATATHTLSAFSKEIVRTIHIQGTKGEIKGVFDCEKDIVKLRRYDGRCEDIDTQKLMREASAHGGGDTNMMYEVYRVLNGEKSITITSISQSIMSHLIGFKAEESRLDNGNTKFIK